MQNEPIKIECRVNDKLGLLSLEQNTTLNEAKEMLFMFTKYLGQLEDKAIMEKDQPQKLGGEPMDAEKIEEALNV